MTGRGVYAQEVGDLICLGNDSVELGFSRGRNGALMSLLDKKTGYQFRREAVVSSALFRLALRRRDNKELEWIESGEATRFEWSAEKQDDCLTLTLTASAFPNRALQVQVKITLCADSALSQWRIAVCDVGETSVYQVICPMVSGLFKIGDPAPGEALAVPVQGEGYLFRNPYPVVDRLPLRSGAGPESPDVGVGAWQGRYPGNIGMQLFLYHNDLAGLYLATHDDGQNVKAFEMRPRPEWGDSPVLSISHFPSEVVGADFRLAYDTVLGVFHGDWYDGADIYKAWATKQWWCRKKLWDRDIADWLRTGVGIFQMSNYHIPALKINHSMSRIAEVVNGLSKESGAPLLALVFNWENGGAWTGPVGFFPPREGEAEFKEAMRRLRAAGNYGFVYITGGCWYLKLPYDPPFNSWPAFEAEGRPSAVKAVDGSVPVGRWYPGWESTRLCVHTDYTQKLTASILLKCLDLGCTVVQIDNFPCGGQQACYDASHGHPLGHGPWWSEAWGKTLAETRRQAKAKDPNCAITTEGISENFIPYLDMYDQRAGNMEYFGHYSRGMPMGGETIPLFNYVYGEYIGAYCAAMPECNRPEVLYWTRCLGKAVTQGAAPTGGCYFPEPKELNPVTIALYKKVVRAAANLGASACSPRSPVSGASTMCSAGASSGGW